MPRQIILAAIRMDAAPASLEARLVRAESLIARAAAQVMVSAEYFDDTFIADANGNVVAKTKLNGDDLVVSTVKVGESTPMQNGTQPEFGLSALVYALDGYSNVMLKPYYDGKWKK